MNLLPREIIPTVLCYVVNGDYEDENTMQHNEQVDIAICNSNGYLIEISNKKIINSCYILIEDATKLYIYQQYNKENFTTYYLAKNKNGVIIVVKKWKNMLLVVKCFKNIKDFKIFDYEKKGYPQIGLYYFDNNDVHIIQLSEFDNFKLGIDSYFSLQESEVESNEFEKNCGADETDQNSMEIDEIVQAREKEKSMMTEYLLKKLQGMKIFKNELDYELNNLNLMLKKGLKNEFSLSQSRLDADIKFNNSVKIKFTKFWSKIHNSHWILGIEFWSFNIRDLNDIKIFMKNGNFNSCIYKVFSASGKSVKALSCNAGKFLEEKERKRTPDELKSFDETCLKYIAVFAVEIPEFGNKSEFSIGFIFSLGKDEFNTKTFKLRPENLFSEKCKIFAEENEPVLCEDLLACLVVSMEINIIVEMRYNLGVCLEEILCKNLYFEKVEILGENYFIKKNGHFRGTSIIIEKNLYNFITWKVRVAVRDLSRLKILVKALYNELPMPVKIQVDKNWRETEIH